MRRPRARLRVTPWVALVAVGATGAACSGPPGAGLLRGRDLGTFAVVAQALDDDCGGPLSAPASFAYEIELSHEATELFWDGRAVGRVSGSSDFSVEASVSVPLDDEGACRAYRRDSIEGTLAPSLERASSFAATMTYAFSREEGADCLEPELVPVDLPPLPCRIRYQLSGSQVRVPESFPE